MTDRYKLERNRKENEPIRFEANTETSNSASNHVVEGWITNKRIWMRHTNGEVVSNSLGTTTYRVSSEPSASDVETATSDSEEDSEKDGRIVTIVVWQCRADKKWISYPDAVSHDLE